MRAAIERVFLHHPETVDETYFQHMKFASRFAGLLLLASTAAIVHAVIPCLFESTAGRLIRRMHSDIENR